MAVYTANTRSIYGFNTLDTLRCASISDICAAGTAGAAHARGSALLVPPARAVSGPSVVLTPCTRIVQAVITVTLSVLGVPNVLDTPSIRGV